MNSFRQRKLLGFDASYKRMEALIKSQRSPHALLISGEKGGGKRTFALHFAMALLCKEGLYPCFSCSSCRKAVSFNHPDIIYAEGNEKTGSIGVDEIRRLRQATSKVPQEGKKKIFIIEDAQNLTPEAQNAFLKILEEPPEDTVFILTCSKEEALLETVLSRLTRLSLPCIGDDLKMEALRAQKDFSSEDISLAAGIFSTVGEALNALPGGNCEKLFKESLKIAEAIEKKDRYAILSSLSSYNQAKERENFKEIISLTLKVCLYNCKKGSITPAAMSKINKVLCRALSLLGNNVSPVAVGAVIAEGICS